jgi:hypothetical protein
MNSKNYINQAHLGGKKDDTYYVKRKDTQSYNNAS